MPVPCFSIDVILDITARIMGMEHMPIEPTRAAEMYSPTIIKSLIYIYTHTHTYNEQYEFNNRWKLFSNMSICGTAYCL